MKLKPSQTMVALWHDEDNKSKVAAAPVSVPIHDGRGEIVGAFALLVRSKTMSFQITVNAVNCLVTESYVNCPSVGTSQAELPGVKLIVYVVGAAARGTPKAAIRTPYRTKGIRGYF